jgi:osmotically-inducible protein OsmY
MRWSGARKPTPSGSLSTCKGSWVILNGGVRSWAEREEAERVAWPAPGMTAVENRITIEP